MIFNCTSPDGNTIDKFVFDNNKNSMNVSVRIKVNTYDNDAEYDNMIPFRNSCFSSIIKQFLIEQFLPIFRMCKF